MAGGASRPLFFFGIPLAGFFLVLFFIYLGFPYAQLGDYLAHFGRAAGFEVTFEDIGPRLGLAGPGIEARGVRVNTSDGKFVPLDRALLRPAWSLSWLRAQPAVYAELEGPIGGAEGTLEVGSPWAWRGDLREVDVGRMPFEGLSKTLDGKLDAKLDLTIAEEGAEGDVTFEAKNGSLQLPDFPTPVPFETLTGEIALGGQQTAELKSFSLAGPLVSAEVSGTVGRAPRFEMSPLRLEARITAQEGVAQALQSAGMRVGRNGESRVRIQGTISRPQIR